MPLALFALKVWAGSCNGRVHESGDVREWTLLWRLLPVRLQGWGTVANEILQEKEGGKE